MTPNEKMAFVISLAKEAINKGELPIAAAIYHGNELISSAYTTERLEGRFLVHAEQKTLMDVDMQKLPYSVRTKLELYTNLEPCLMCLGMAISSFVGKIYYSLEAPEDGAIGFVRVAFEKRPSETWHFPEVNSGLFREESMHLFREYVDRNQNNTEYSAGLIQFAKTLAQL